MTIDKELFGLLAVALTIISYIPYFHGIRKGTIKPHAFSWLLWSLITGISYMAQTSAGSGPGAWAAGISTFLTLSVAIASLKYGEKNITRSDWVVFIAGLSAIPAWILTDNPLWSVVIVSAIDTVGYIPTIRKSWSKPTEEGFSRYTLSSVNKVLSLLAIEVFIVTTWLHTATILLMNIVLLTVMLYRRHVLRKGVVHAA
ncbi:MAG: hypothetical protein AB7G06_03655 [Bdellovibrionales bacterium]